VKEEKKIIKDEVEKDNENKEGWRDRRGSLKRKRSRSTWRRRRNRKNKDAKENETKY
jgi:hypothetical protein